MLDTVVLSVPRSDFQILDHSSFQPSTAQIHLFSTGHAKYVNNPAKNQKQSGNYYPRLTVNARGSAVALRIECSLPKLLFGNNLDELEESDLPLLLRTLRARMIEMNVLVTVEALRTAQVLAVHFGKNIPLSNGYTACYIIRQLQKVDLTQRLDLTSTQFRNEGKSLQYYSASHSCVFYDKIADLNQPKGRAIDKDQTPEQFSLFEQITGKKQREEVLRLEIRLSKRVKLKQVTTLEDPRLYSVFSNSLAKKVVYTYWQQFVRNSRLLIVNEDPFTILDSIMISSPTIKPKQAVYLVGLALLANAKGLRSIKNYVQCAGTVRTLQRMKKDFTLLQGLNSDLLHGYMQHIDSCISVFSAYKCENASKML